MLNSRQSEALSMQSVSDLHPCANTQRLVPWSAVIPLKVVPNLAGGDSLVCFSGEA